MMDKYLENLIYERENLQCDSVKIVSFEKYYNIHHEEMMNIVYNTRRIFTINGKESHPFKMTYLHTISMNELNKFISSQRNEKINHILHNV